MRLVPFLSFVLRNLFEVCRIGFDFFRCWDQSVLEVLLSVCSIHCKTGILLFFQICLDLLFVGEDGDGLGDLVPISEDTGATNTASFTGHDFDQIAGAFSGSIAFQHSKPGKGQSIY